MYKAPQKRIVAAAMFLLACAPLLPVHAEESEFGFFGAGSEKPYFGIYDLGSDAADVDSGTPPPLGDVPVDGGLSLLLAAGSVYGYRQVRRSTDRVGGRRR